MELINVTANVLVDINKIMSLTREKTKKETNFLYPQREQGTDLRMLLVISQLKINCLTIASNSSPQFKFLNGVKNLASYLMSFCFPKAASEKKFL